MQSLSLSHQLQLFLIILCLINSLPLKAWDTQVRGFPVHLQHWWPLTNTNFPLGPVIRGFPSDTSVVVGERVLFSVAVSGDPEPEISWYHNGTKLGPENDTIILPYNCLSIASTKLSHSGVYRMYARNSGGTARDEFRLKVRLAEQEHQNLTRQLMMENLTDHNRLLWNWSVGKNTYHQTS